MRLRRINMILHRDLGYFFAGTTVIYAISGLAVNHVDHWNPHFVIERRPVTVSAPLKPADVTDEWVNRVLSPLGEHQHYRSHYFPSSGKVKIYLDEGSIFINLVSGEGEFEVVRRRPVLYAMNRLHLSPEKAWLVFSDVFSAALIVIVVTGLLILKGKNGLAGRGLVLVTAGLIVPLVFLFLV